MNMRERLYDAVDTAIRTCDQGEVYDIIVPQLIDSMLDALMEPIAYTIYLEVPGDGRSIMSQESWRKFISAIKEGK